MQKTLKLLCMLIYFYNYITNAVLNYLNVIVTV